MKVVRFLLSWIKPRYKFQSRPGAAKNIDQCEKLIEYRFNNPVLLAHALRHRSIIVETGDTRKSANERLEFLGDAVLDLIVSEQLYKQYPDAREGFLARLKSLAVSGRQLSSKAKLINLGDYMQISPSEVRNGGRTRRSILEDGLEAVIGAVYLDGGLKEAENFVHRFVAYDLNRRLIREKEENYKSLLLEYSQGKAMGAPLYRVTNEEGPDHAKIFHVDVHVAKKNVGSGSGRSKKEAEQEAAKAASAFFGLQT
ncbi:MAG: ribonuclease III [Candidatus Electryonea clarkiae]|nr:ribonuclease III [Candidatus Electryonea clarkiae]MDP8287383.1 ribonuclease III [Candidatus Electryonea clarkiae]